MQRVERRYRLVLESGLDIGWFKSDADDWRVGDDFIYYDSTRFLIAGIVDANGQDGDYAGTWIVRVLELPEP